MARLLVICFLNKQKNAGEDDNLNSPILQVVFLAGLLYGFIVLFVGMKQKQDRSTYQLGLFLGLIIGCGAAFLLTIGFQ